MVPSDGRQSSEETHSGRYMGQAPPAWPPVMCRQNETRERGMWGGRGPVIETFIEVSEHDGDASQSQKHRHEGRNDRLCGGLVVFVV